MEAPSTDILTRPEPWWLRWLRMMRLCCLVGALVCPWVVFMPEALRYDYADVGWLCFGLMFWCFFFFLPLDFVIRLITDFRSRRSLLQHILRLLLAVGLLILYHFLWLFYVAGVFKLRHLLMD